MGILDKKTAIITGGSSGIGQGIALEFARQGANIVVCGRTQSKIDSTLDSLKAISGASLGIIADVTNKKQVENMMKQTKEKFGRIDILINDAGIAPANLLKDMPEEDWDSVINTNLKGVFLCIQAVSNYMIEQHYGKIINIGSMVGVRPTRARLGGYSASKAGVLSLTKTATLELTQYGINVNCIAPGAIETPQYRIGRTQAQIDEWLTAAKKAPAGRVGTPQDIAKLAVFLASDESSFICGETIVIDGGRSAQNP